ncbi:hypothetical protein AWH62_06675 [Maricaulis sp. W15]|uniref:copper chaperone PCu(A)C n=1 Tax=Maricaulis sp. W15 TaxID=1772333 RepID=UPI000948C261|nr:copper chaperone PCu(A)C [Maricaulis sp. W15]OLF75495.1 hypothetical protein AWH62_06675 [Maricaulis sp. W15]
MQKFVPLVALATLLTACGGGDESHQDAAQGPREHAGNHHGDVMPAADDEQAPLPDDGIAPVIEVRNAWIRPHPNGRDVTAAYFTARLSQGHADRLLSVQVTGAGRVELHGHTMDEQGMMRMRPIAPPDLVDSDPLVFMPGGFHLMVHGLAPIIEGDTVPGVLVFERAGEIAVTFSVRNTAPESPAED